MATNAAKTRMVNLALAKLHGATDSGTVYVPDIDDSVFASPTTATGTARETIINACMVYPNCLKRALRDIHPKFARRFADLGPNIEITEGGAAGTIFKRADWYYLFQLPSDFLDLIAQIDEASKNVICEAKIITAYNWAHIVKGTDEKAYYCILNHTADTAKKPTSGGTYATYWALFNADDAYGADWETGKAYLASSNLILLMSNTYSNADADGAFIEYIAYAATGVSDKPDQYDDHFIDAFTTLLAAEIAPWSTEKNRRLELLNEYENLAKPKSISRDARPDYEEEETSWLDARNN